MGQNLLSRKQNFCHKKHKIYKFLQPTQTETHNPKRIHFTLAITQTKLTKSIKHKLELFEYLKRKKNEKKKLEISYGKLTYL